MAWLRERLPSMWTVERSQRAVAGAPPHQRTLDDAISVRASNGTYAVLAVEARRSFAPRDVERLLPGVTRTLRELAGNIPLLVVAPWLSARTRELLAAESINFIDLTGNAQVSVENPTFYISSEGAARDPEPAQRGRAGLRGPKAGRLVRLLADVRPPYGVRELAESAKLTPGYASRLLDALDHQALIERSRRGQVESVDVPGLLRKWAETYDVLATNDVEGFLAPQGAARALTQLAESRKLGRFAVTGSFAAVRVAPVAAAALLLVYCEERAPIVDALGLLPAEQRGDVVLLRPFDPVVWERGAEDQGIPYTAPSQTAVDCLTGTGRMPSEGEALLRWMTENESRWRLDSLAA